MNLKEFNEFSLHDAVHFRDELNPALFEGDKMKEDVRVQLLNIAEDFVEHLGIRDLDIADITVSGSSAAYSYTKHSDIDLHILLDFNQFKDDDVYRELMDAKKIVYNERHDITIGGFPVELYVQDTNKPVISLGEYSVMNDKWIKLPRKRRANFDQESTRLKFEKLYKLAEFAVKSHNLEKLEQVVGTLKRYRQAGLDLHGEFGPENLAYKALRSRGVIARLYDAMQEIHDSRLSLPENEELPEIDEVEMGLAESWKKALGECSGYIPSESEKNDKRWERALSVDVHPNTMKDQAKKFGWKIRRDGVPPTLRP